MIHNISNTTKTIFQDSEVYHDPRVGFQNFPIE